jgi:transposase
MGARLRVYLTAEENRTLLELRKLTALPQRVRDRVEVVRLSHQGAYVENIAEFLDWNIQTVRDTLHRWQQGGLEGLWDASGRGKQPRWQSADLDYLEACLREEAQSYNSVQLARKLWDERQVHLSPGHLRELLKKRG